MVESMKNHLKQIQVGGVFSIFLAPGDENLTFFSIGSNLLKGPG